MQSDTPQTVLSVEDFLERCGDEPRYELIDGVLRDRVKRWSMPYPI